MNLKALILLLTQIVLYSSAFLQSTTSSEISLKILSDSLTCNRACAILSLRFSLSNNSDNDLIIYGLLRGGPYPAGFKISRTCDLINVGTGIAFVLYRSDGTQLIPKSEIIDYKGQRPVTREVLDSALNEMKIHFLKSDMLLKSHEEKMFIKSVPLENFTLKKGLYYFQIAYYCGNMSVRDIDSDVSKPKGKTFQGCAISTKIPFTVK